MTIGRKRKRITERGVKNAGRGCQEWLVFLLCLFLPVTQREKKAAREATWAGKGGREADGWAWRTPSGLEVEPPSAHEPAGIGQPESGKRQA